MASAATFGARLIRRWREGRRGWVSPIYPERSIRIPKGLSVLEASLRHNIPHAAGVPTTTALRRLDERIEARLVRRVKDA